MSHNVSDVLPGKTMQLVRRVQTFEDECDSWARGVIATRVWRDRPALSLVRKKAEVVACSFEQIPPSVLPEDRFAGIVYRRLRVHGGIGNPDMWRMGAKNPEARGFREDWPVPDEVKEELRWWKDHPSEVMGGHGANSVRNENRWLMRYGIAHPHGFVGGHTLPDHGIILKRGIPDLRADIREQRNRRRSPGELDQLAAMDRCLEGMQNHCRICADEARRQAAKATDLDARKHLLEISENCNWLAENAPRTFSQALQLLYFSNCADILDNKGDAASFGRVDQLLFPFYEADMADGRLSEAEALDLVSCFIAKKWYCQTSNNMTLGGLKPDGSDATNALSFIFLEGMEATGLPVDMSVRVHAGTSDAFWHTVARVIRRGFGRPDIYNDAVEIPALCKKGIELEDARDYAPLGCAEIMIPGRSAYRTMSMGLELQKILELVLNNGRCLATGDQVWESGPTAFETYDELIAEYHRRVSQVVDLAVDIIREDERLEPSVEPRPWLTALSRGGIEDAVDMTAGQPKYDPVGVTLDGIADIVNSLLAIKRLVFEECRFSLVEFTDILRNNWEGHEETRQYVLRKLPRFGQDDTAIHAITAEETSYYARCFENHRTYYGGQFWPMIFGVTTSQLPQKNRVGASAGGRRKGDPVAQSLIPSETGSHGTTTELLAACTAIDFSKFPGGVSNVQEFDPSHFEGPEGIDRMVHLLQTFCAMGGLELGPNLISEERLREAQKQPEGFEYLTVRLFGLSAQFVSLTPELQETVIRRVSNAAERLA